MSRFQFNDADDAFHEAQRRIAAVKEARAGGLDLARLGLTQLPATISTLRWLEELNLSGNQLKFLPRSLLRLTSLSRLILHGNVALGIPPEILEQTRYHTNPGGAHFVGYLVDKETVRTLPASPASILDYYFRTVEARRALNEAKLIVIGRGAVGKTSLIKRLLSQKFDEHEKETLSIAITPLEFISKKKDKARLHIWDFGGQEILHATHQIFLTERTLYLVVLGKREGKAGQDVEYWLQLIQSFGRDSKVIIALNKSSTQPFDVNRSFLQEKYPTIVDFVKTDCESGMGISELRKLILHETESLDHFNANFPLDWFEIKERLASMGENFITWNTYRTICHEFGEQDSDAQTNLAYFLNVLGIALNYRDDRGLKDTHVLNPKWVTEGIYPVLRSATIHNRSGVLDVDDLKGILDQKRYPPDMHEFLLRLMQRFQLCFKMPGEGRRYLIPELFGENQPDIKFLLEMPGVGFRYQYEVLPEGLLPRFIVQTHRYSESNPQLRWHTGVVLESSNCRAVIRADGQERRVDIHVIGKPELQRRELLAVVRSAFEEQHRYLKGIIVEERVPIPGVPGVTLSYRDLINREARGETAFYPENMNRPVFLEELLNGVEPKAGRSARMHEAGTSVESSSDPLLEMGKQVAVPGSSIRFHIFLSHNSTEKLMVRELKNLLMNNGMEVWLDEEQLRPGIPWQQLLEEGIRSSASVGVLIGKDGLGPWEDQEMQGALAMAKNDRRPIIPILLPNALTEPKLPMFLSTRTWVDLREGFSPDGIARIIWGITGKKP